MIKKNIKSNAETHFDSYWWNKIHYKYNVLNIDIIKNIVVVDIKLKKENEINR